MKKSNLDTGERDVLASFEKDEWHSVPSLENEIAAFRAFAKTQSEKMRLVNITLSREDWEGVQTKAREAGVPSETLISIIVHQFVKETLRQ